MFINLTLLIRLKSLLFERITLKRSSSKSPAIQCRYSYSLGWVVIASSIIGSRVESLDNGIGGLGSLVKVGP
jgi:hypothetical protein